MCHIIICVYTISTGDRVHWMVHAATAWTPPVEAMGHIFDVCVSAKGSKSVMHRCVKVEVKPCFYCTVQVSLSLARSLSLALSRSLSLSLSLSLSVCVCVCVCVALSRFSSLSFSLAISLSSLPLLPPFSPSSPPSLPPFLSLASFE